MKLWYLYGRGNSGFDFDYDQYFGFVVRAESEDKAREIAMDKSHRDHWLDSELSLCEELLASGEEGVILSDFNAG